MAVAHDPVSAGRMVFADPVTQETIVEDAGIEAKLAGISAIIEQRLGKVSAEAVLRRDSEGGPDGALTGLRAWADQDFPENVVHACEQHYYANDRVVSALLGHLVEHVVIGEELRSIALAARRRAADELDQIPPSMTEFVNRLMAAGVVVEDVRKMSKQRLAAVVSAIRGIEAAEAEVEVRSVPGMDDGAIPHKSLSSSIDEAVAGEPAVKDAARPVLEAAGEPVVEAPQEAVDGTDGAGTGGYAATSEGPAELMLEVPNAPVETPAPAVPETRWGVLDLTRIGYDVEVVTASTDRDTAALKMRMPDVSAFKELAARGTPEMALADGIVENRNRTLVERFFRTRSRRVGFELSEADQRVWVLLLAELPTLGKSPSFGEYGWFDGLSVPLGDGSTKVARLRAIDRSEDGLREALKG